MVEWLLTLYGSLQLCYMAIYCAPTLPQYDTTDDLKINSTSCEPGNCKAHLMKLDNGNAVHSCHQGKPWLLYSNLLYSVRNLKYETHTHTHNLWRTVTLSSALTANWFHGLYFDIPSFLTAGNVKLLVERLCPSQHRTVCCLRIA